MCRRTVVGVVMEGLGVREREFASRPRVGGVGERLGVGVRLTGEEGERVWLRLGLWVWLRLRGLISIASGLFLVFGFGFSTFSEMAAGARRNSNSPLFTILTSCPSTGRSLSSTVTSSILRTVSIPPTTCPKHTFFVSKCVAASSVMKNCELFVSGPRLAMQTSPGQSTERHPMFSSEKCGP